MEATVMEQIQSEKLKQEKMNAERKLTKEQRSQKRTRKLAERFKFILCKIILFHLPSQYFSFR